MTSCVMRAVRLGDDALPRWAPSSFAHVVLARVFTLGVQPAPRVVPPAEPEPAPPPVQPVAMAATPRASSDVDEAIADLLELQRRVLVALSGIVAVAPHIQRLFLTTWAACLRSLQDRLTAAHTWHPSVGVVHGRLRDFSRTYWPGPVSALIGNARPCDCARELGVASAPATWADVARLAEEALDAALAEDGVDDDGWADAAAMEPRHADRRALFGEVSGELDRMCVGPRKRSLEPDDAEVVQRTARRLRWLRGMDIDAPAWAAALGRLRQLAYERPEVRAAVNGILDPSYRPAGSWARDLGYDPERERRVRMRRELFDSVPQASSSLAAAADWFVRAVELCVDSSAIAEALRPVADLVAAIDPASLPGDRRFRRRLEAVRAVIRGDGDGVAPDSSPGSAPPEQVDEFDDSRVPPVVRAVASVTTGLRALYVGNREDPELRERLVAGLQLESCTWCASEPRKAQAEAERIRNGQYDIVLLATGFQGHATERCFVEACRSAGVKFSRVDHGRLVGCARAIARDLGIAVHQL